MRTTFLRSLLVHHPQALHNAKAMLGTLAQQHADLEQRRRANLAFSGQTLVGSKGRLGAGQPGRLLLEPCLLSLCLHSARPRPGD